MKTRRIGELTVSEVGMGCMAFSHGYGRIPPEQYSIEAIQNAYRHGCTFFDTAEVYSPNLTSIGHNERIVGDALRDVHGEVVLATKLFLDRSEVHQDGSVYDTVRRHLEASMERLQTDMVDLYYLHRTSGGVSVEEVAEAMGRLIDEG
ncbi:MAG: aldo/keto reductase, partial [Oscillospiraceae bacterium]|nr:aldo/keto reductase [Oscillospiraceae bacterium]